VTDAVTALAKNAGTGQLLEVESLDSNRSHFPDNLHQHSCTGAICEYNVAPLPPEASPVRNQLFCGDNLEVLRLRRYFPDESIDLIYLDPPFKSNKNYNLLFREKDGSLSTSQILAFEDTWERNQEAERNFSGGIDSRGQTE
jgi:16S rRNA G966 N2-methylase RsmD